MIGRDRDVQNYLLFGLLALAIASLGLNLYLLRKVQWIIRYCNRLRRAMDRKFHQQFRQMQCLQALHEDLALPFTLPPAGGKAASADFLKLVADHVRREKPEVVVECGSGLSTTVIARCLQLNGRGQVYSLEHMDEFAHQTRRELARQGLDDWASVVDAPLEPLELKGREWQWYALRGAPDSPIDLLIVDGPPARTGINPRYPAGPMLFPRLSSRGAVLIDDARRAEEAAVIARWRKEFPSLTFDSNVEDYDKGVCKVSVSDPPQAATVEAPPLGVGVAQESVRSLG